MLRHNLSTKPELLPLAGVVGALNKAAQQQGVAFFLMGAAARDVLLLHTHGITTLRKTEDVDFGVMVSSWPVFDALRGALLQGGDFTARPGEAAHRLRHASGLPLDIVPFGGVERADRTLAWPPAEHTVFNCFGMREALQTASQVLLPQQAVVNVPSIPALALLKITAWQDRHYMLPGRDAPDLLLYLRHHLDCGNMERAAVEHADLFDGDDYDHEATSARLLARDMRRLMDAPATQRIITILQPQADANGPLLLARQSGMALEAARRLILALVDELKHAAK
jgi:predicted nucleotidyltransferase